VGLVNGEGRRGMGGEGCERSKGGGGSGRNAWRVVGEGGSCRAGLLLARFDVRCWDAGW